MTTDNIVIDYEPRSWFVPFHQRSARFASLVCHRRSGKTVACVNDVGAKALYTSKQHARYAYIAPFYRQAKDVAWQYLKQFLEPAITRIRESELRVELINGSWITLYGADNPDALRGIYLDGVILDEYGDCRPSLWGQVILPTLVDRRGWAVFIGTAKGKNHFYKQHRRLEEDPDAYSLTLPASKSGLISQVELEEIASQMSPEEYEQEMECSFEAALPGTYYTQLLNEADAQGRITDLNPSPGFPTYAAMDLGYTDSTSIWFWQLRPDGIAMVDFEQHDSEPLSFYFDLLASKAYEYETIWLPHDARARSLQTGRTTIEQFVEDQLPVRIVPNQKLQHGIDAARAILPHVWFHVSDTDVDQRRRMLEGIECLRAYRRSFSEITQSFTDTPVHDWTSHASDAFRYFALVTEKRRPQEASRPTNRSPDKWSWSLDDLHAWRDEQLSRRFNRSRL